MKSVFHQLTRVGGRARNEDRAGYCRTARCSLLALADGMGGHPQGDLAAAIAVGAMARGFGQQARPSLDDPHGLLLDGILDGHRRLLRHAHRHRLTDTPRTTLVACVVQDDAAWWAHCGDSRLYLVRDGRLVARTRDHSFQELQASERRWGALPPHVNRHVLYTCLGSPGLPRVDSHGPCPLQPGDRLLLCSDGLWSEVPDDEIVEALARLALEDAMAMLVDLAISRGGPRGDNVTAVGMVWTPADAAGADLTAAPAAGLLESTFADDDLGPGDDPHDDFAGRIR